MNKKHIGLLAAGLAMAAVIPGFVLAKTTHNGDNHNNDYDNNYRGDHSYNDRLNRDNGDNYDNGYVNRGDEWDYRDGYRNSDYRRKNAAAYSNYVPVNNYNYGNYNYGYNCNCPGNYPTIQSYYYNPAPGAVNYVQFPVSGCGYQNQYYYAGATVGCNQAYRVY